MITQQYVSGSNILEPTDKHDTEAGQGSCMIHFF